MRINEDFIFNKFTYQQNIINSIFFLINYIYNSYISINITFIRYKFYNKIIYYFLLFLFPKGTAELERL